MEFSLGGVTPPPPSKENNYFFPHNFLDKVCLIHNIMKNYKIARDSRHFEGTSKFVRSGGRWGVIIREIFYWFISCFRPFKTVWRGLIFLAESYSLQLCWCWLILDDETYKIVIFVKFTPYSCCGGGCLLW